MKCCICLDCLICKSEIVNKPLSITKCGHLFHTECIKSYFSSLPANRSQCPLCRKRVLNGEIQNQLEFDCDCEQSPILSNEYFNFLSQYKLKDIGDIKSKIEILSEKLETANSKTGDFTNNLFKLTILTLSELTELLSEQTKTVARLEQSLQTNESSSSKSQYITNKKVGKLIDKFNGLSIKQAPKKPKINAKNAKTHQDLELELAIYKSYFEQGYGLSIEDIIDETAYISTKCSELKISDNK